MMMTMTVKKANRNPYNSASIFRIFPISSGIMLLSCYTVTDADDVSSWFSKLTNQTTLSNSTINIYIINNDRERKSRREIKNWYFHICVSFVSPSTRTINKTKIDQGISAYHGGDGAWPARVHTHTH